MSYCSSVIAMFPTNSPVFGGFIVREEECSELLSVALHTTRICSIAGLVNSFTEFEFQIIDWATSGFVAISFSI
jgi:hypothetical protein